jgi:hypothetical protein
MNNYIAVIYLGLVLISSACTIDEECQDQEFSLLGKWGLVESCFDIGDGTKNCTGHNRESTYEFFEDGTVHIVNTNVNCISRYELEGTSLEVTSDADCLTQSFFFNMLDVCTITISPLCIEGCPHRYEKF